jgi:hypothetical protein
MGLGIVSFTGAAAVPGTEGSMDFRYQIVDLLRAPVAENPAFRDLGLRWRYLPMNVAPADLPAAVAGARAVGWCGERPSLPVMRAALAEAFRGTVPAVAPSPV